MRGIALILVCAAALVQADHPQRYRSGQTCQCPSEEAAKTCSRYGTDGELIPHENCNQFYKCSNGEAIPYFCPAELLYDPETKICDWPHSVQCASRPIVDENEVDCCHETDDSNQDSGSDTQNGNNESTCNCEPGDAPDICSEEGSDGILVAHENCNYFYKCDHDVPVAICCPSGLLYNPYNQRCDWAHSVDCGDRPIVEVDGENNGDNGNGNGDSNGSGSGDNGSGNGDNGTSESTCNCNPGEAPGICAANGSDGILIAHTNCNQFYKCDHGVPVAFFCPSGLLYNPYSEQCDWPHNVQCGDRPVVEIEEGGNNNGNEDCSQESNNGNGDNGSGSGTCNCNPVEAPAICATDGSNGVLIAHENCNQFYKCDHGTPIVLNCPSELMYNPYTEVCDWAHKVECGDRPIVEIDNGNGDNNGSGNGENGNGNGDNGGGNGNGDNGTGSGTCNCNPGEAPGICATDGSNGVLIAHENCNQFYKCDHGTPIVLNCPSELMYNPYTEVCDWAHKVECGDRPIVEIDNGNGDNNGSGNGENGNGNGDNGGGNGNGDNGTGSGTCNCNPGEAPGICATDGSNGVLIAHENCNQFYKCDHGTPIVLNCPSELMYNPYTEVCDWAHKVECGDRPIVEIDNGNGDNNGSGNGENGNGNGDNGGGNGNGDNGTGSGTCNCNPGEAPGICATDGSNGVLIAHENCNQFYKCDHGTPIVLNCPSELMYNPYTEVCDWAHKVECGDRPIVEIDNGNGDNNGSGNGENGNGNGDNGGGNGNGDNGTGSGTCNCNPGEAPGICATDGSNGVLIAHENCNQFYKCDHGTPIALNCPSELMYNPYTEVCDWAHKVECGDRPIVEIDNGNVDNNGSGNGENGNGNGDNGGGNGNGDNGTGSGTCNCNPGEAPGICAADGSDGIFIAHEHCNQFYKCDHGASVAFYCPSGLLYNPYTEVCDWPHKVECGDRTIVEVDNGGDNNGGDNGETEGNGNGDNGSGNENGDSGSSNGNGDSGSGNGNGDNGTGSGTCNCNPGEAPGICAAEGSDGILIAHEHCNQFYKCDHGASVAFYCPSGLLYNPYAEVCDWPHKVECGDRTIVEVDNGGDNNGGDNGETEDNGNGDNGSSNGNSDSGSGNGNGDNGTGSGTCNCNPGEAPAICAADGSDGILIAHEHCNQFYKCDHGASVAFYCPSGLLYNPYTEVCDWAHKVECGDRIIVEVDNGGDNNGGDNSETEGNGNGDNGSGNENGDSGSGNGNGDNGTGSGTCNCNPGEAPAICAADGSDGILIAHEHCNQFYKCDHGESVAFYCPSGLLYNPYTKVCDWPHKVECGDRTIVEVDNGGNNNGGDNGETEGNGNGDNGSSNENGDNGNGDNGTGSGICNCNPGEAPGICAAEGSDGVLIAHEHCNQFYKCDHGASVAFYCPSGLLYNPYTEMCNWPHKVECGDRTIVEVDNGGDNGGDNGETEGNGNSDNGSGNGHGDNGGTCNCNPEEAPAICATGNSEGVLIAHEKCNKFYKCSFGNPVALVCPDTLLYNPLIEVCDWPQNVNCGDRAIPEAGSDNGVDNNGNDNNGGGSNGGDNNSYDTNGGDYSEPSQAPAICAVDGSDGVLVAHENCDQFYVCSLGSPVVIDCPGNLLYNPENEQCDWPRNIDCGDRDTPPPAPKGEDGVCMCNPRQAPSVCSGNGSDGKMIAHKYCNQYYVCFNGKPITRSCPASLFYDPHTRSCNWPAAVSCEGRIEDTNFSLNKHMQARRGVF